jgi:hypothetical protein
VRINLKFETNNYNNNKRRRRMRRSRTDLIFY